MLNILLAVFLAAAVLIDDQVMRLFFICALACCAFVAGREDAAAEQAFNSTDFES